MTLPSTSPQRIAIGMSGGLDSSVVAALMKERGFDVIGLTLHLYKEGSRCCSIDDVQRARAVCEGLGIRHYTVNAVDFFEEHIIAPFVEGYAQGKTPSPCVLCNQYIKFGVLQQRAWQLDCSHIATGHYVRREASEGRWRLFMGSDAKKDQSYFLHRLSQKQLDRSLFPLEGWTKDQVRAYAKKHELPVSTDSRSESQDLCFITAAGPAPFVEKRRPDLKRTGSVQDESGTALGTHEGVHRYTVGQRKGLGIASSAPLYVKEIDPVTQTVFVGFRHQVEQPECLVEDIHWIAGEAPDPELPVTVRLRYRHAGATGRWTARDDKTLRLVFDEPQFAVAPGQAAVFYHGDEVLGGGWIQLSKKYEPVLHNP